MDNYIINSFIYNNINSLNDIKLYLIRYYPLIDDNVLQHEIKLLIKNSLLIVYDKKYKLTNEGVVVLNDNIYYHSKIIINFIKKNSKIYKKYELREIRMEQQSLRKYLINNKKHICIICSKHLPLELLETAHLKPRYLLDKCGLYDKKILSNLCVDIVINYTIRVL